MASKLARRLSLAIPLAALAIAAFAPGAAFAGPLVASAPNCAAQSISQVFLPWADVANYTIAPGGSFEPGAPNWSKSGAAEVDGNEPFFVGDDVDGNALTIPNGASATSPAICVGIGHPDIRFFVKSSSVTGQLNVEVLFEDAAGNVQSLPMGSAAGTTSWSLSTPLPIVANLLPLLPNDMTAVAFRFTASGASFRIDDVYVDPYRWT
jgi:hypothetical protein